MCFSATASFAAAAVLGGIGAMTVSKVTKSSELPLAVVPLIFAVQQGIEGMLWLTVPFGRTNGIWLASAFAAIALILWPVLTPIAAALVEPRRNRRRLIYTLLLPGGVVAIYSAITILTHPYLAWPASRALTYVNNDPYPPALAAAYLIAVCVPPLISSSPPLRVFGVIVLVGLVVSILAFYESVVSVWCFFAAMASITLLAYFRGHTRLPATTAA
jgi:hypothetical protein